MAYFFGSRKDLGPLLLDGEEVAGAPARYLGLAPRFAPLCLHLLLLEDDPPRAICRHPGY